MKTPKTLVAVFCILFAVSCKKKEDAKPAETADPLTPTACFSTSSCFIKAGETVTFASCSENAEKVEWNFGDGTTSDLPSPKHVFSKKGLYKVRLTSYYKDKIAQRDTTIACDMSAFVHLTLKFSWHMNQEVNSHPYIFDIGSELHKSAAPNAFGNLVYHGYMYSNSQAAYLDSLVLKIPIADASEKYFVSTIIEGVYPLPSNDPAVDMYHQEHFGRATTKDFDLFSMPRLKGINELDIVTVTYSVSSAVFE